MPVAAGFLEGPPVDLPAPPPARPWGRQLSDADVRRVNDLVWSFLIDGCSLSPADALRVMRRHQSDRHVRRRRGETSNLIKSRGLLPLILAVVTNAKSKRG